MGYYKFHKYSGLREDITNGLIAHNPEWRVQFSDAAKLVNDNQGVGV
jgi:hypothetical protein